MILRNEGGVKLMTYRLRGNSFLLLLLRALRECTGNGNGDRLTGTGLWIDFMRVFDDRYNPRKTITDTTVQYREVLAEGYKKLRQYFSEYLSGVFHFGSVCLPKDLPGKAKSIFSSDLDDSSFRKALERLNYACHRYFGWSDNENGRESQSDLVLGKIVAGIIETIKDDDTFEGPFFTGKKIVQKENLYAENDYILQLFLFDIWYKIVTEHYGDAEGGKETCNKWTQSEQRANTYEPRTMVLPIGQERAKTLRVTTDIEHIDNVQVYQQLLSIYRPTRRLPLPTGIEPELMAHIDHWFDVYKSRDIPIKTPQMLYMLFCYPNCKLIKIFNAIQPDSFFNSINCNGKESILKPKSPYGDYLIKVCEHFNKLYEHNEEHYDESGNSVREI